MDSFTERVLERARERQKKLENYYSHDKGAPKSPLRETNNILQKLDSTPNLSSIAQTVKRKEIVSDSDLFTKITRHDILKENKSDSNVDKVTRQSSLTKVLSDTQGGTESPVKMLNIQKENFNMEIKLTSSENIRVEVEIEERDDSDEENTEGGIVELKHEEEDKSALREDAKKRLQRLGKLYAGGEDPNLSSPIHRNEEKFLSEETSSDIVIHSEKPKGRALGRLAALAKDINEWQDEIKTPKDQSCDKKQSPKKSWKPPAPQPPTVTSTVAKKSPVKPLAPKPPAVNSFSSPVKAHVSATVTNIGSTSPTKNESKVDSETKSLQWDKSVLQSLESQGFTRSTSKAKLVYNYNNSQGKSDVKSAEITKVVQSRDFKNDKIIEENETMDVNPIQENGTSEVARIASKFSGSNETVADTKFAPPKSPTKSNFRGTGKVLNVAARFESSPPKSPSKDPALLSLSERKALFEKNKGTALIPKAAFGMAAPTIQEQPKKQVAATPGKYQAPKPPSPVKQTLTQNNIHNSPTKAAIEQAGGIAKTMAALLQKKSTISQSQIENKIQEQRKQEMDMLLNRFHRNENESNSEESDDEIDEPTETTAMINEKCQPTIVKSGMVPPPPPPPGGADRRKSGSKRPSVGVGDSPKVAAVLEDSKHIRVKRPKEGQIYPCLSDIETATETENEVNTASTSANSSRDANNSSYSESEVGDTSFGREILQAVCKNQSSATKRPIYDESTASDVSDILDGMDDYLDEALACDSDESPGPTPPKHGKQTTAKPSHSFAYKRGSPKSSPNRRSPQKSPVKNLHHESTSELPTYVDDGGNVLPLQHTVSFYRKQQTQGPTSPVRHISRQAVIMEINDEAPSTAQDESTDVNEKIQQLLDEVCKQQTVISQTSQALNLCYSTFEFSGSSEQVEGEKLLLIATHRRQAAMNEVQRLQVERTLRPNGKNNHMPLERGSLTISDINLPLKREYVKALAAAGGKGHHIICLVRCGEHVYPTQLVSTVATSSSNPETCLKIPGFVKLDNIYGDFTVTLEVYCLQAQEELLSHDIKYHINKKGNKSTPKKSKHESRLVMPVKQSPAGPQAVRSPSFAHMGYVVFSIQAINKTHWSLNKVPPMSPLEGSIQMRINCELQVSVQHRGFLTMFEDVSGFGAWHRRWCLLNGHVLSYWKYPDDEKKKAPIDSINLKACSTQSVGPVSREICARLHTFLLERERPAQRGDKDSLVMICRGNTTTIRHLLSADTKEERIEWCQKFNKSLAAIRMFGQNSE